MPSNCCCMKDCPSKAKTDKHRSFFGFPIDNDRCQAWIKACGNPDLDGRSVEFHYRNSHICDLHFKPSDRNKKKLKPDAIPFPYDQHPVESKSTQTEGKVKVDSDSDIEIVPDSPPTASTSRRITGTRKKNQLTRLQEKITALQEKKQGTLKPELFKLIELETILNTLNKDKKCAKNLNMYALNLYIGCPSTYNVLRRTLRLPSEKVLRKNDLEIYTTMSHDVIVNLKEKIGHLSAIDKHCIVCLKKVPLKRFLFYHITKDRVIGFRNIDGEQRLQAATHVYLLMARGLKAKWEQLVAYSFTDQYDDHASIQPWLDSVLNILRIIGFEIVALVVDHEDFYDYFKNNIRSSTQPIIRTGNENDQIYCIFDLPQLIISLRNLLMKHKLQFKDDDGSLVIADWGVIENLYYKNNGKFVSKLTTSHVFPNDAEKEELNYAVEVFSKTVSEALTTESHTSSDTDKRIRGTLKLAALVNDVFDILNSSTHNHHNKYKNAFTGEPHQMRTIRRFMEFLTNVEPLGAFEDGDKSFNCIYGLRISVMSFSIILRDLLPRGIKSLVTHRFNLDAANNFFDFVRQKSRSKQPTAVEFYKCFRQKFMLQLTKHGKTNEDTDNLQKFLSKVYFKQMTRHKMTIENFKKSIEVKTVDYRFELPPVDSFHYTCWYLLKKCYDIHNHSSCDRFEKLIQVTTKHTSIRWKQYTQDSTFKPPEVIVKLIKRFDSTFSKSFGHRLEIGLGTGMLLAMRQLEEELVCGCFPLGYLRRLFVRMRIFQIIRYNNRRLGDENFHFTSTDFYNVDTTSTST